MNRWIHGIFALATLAVVVGLIALWPRPDRILPRPPIGVPTATSIPTGPPQPTGPGSTDAPCPGHGRPADLSVLTFNIHGGLDHTGYQLERIAQEIEAWDADVVLLQEVDRNRERTGFTDQPSWLAVRLGLHVVFGSNVVRPPAAAGQRQQEYGTAILSRLPILSWSNQMLPNQPGLEPRGLLRASIRLDGQRLDIYNTHLQHTRGNIRILQMRAIRALMVVDGRPRLLGGDFNADPSTPAYRIATRFLSDPWPRVGSGPGLTVPPNVPRRRIDYVLYDGPFTPTSAEVLRSSVSDHLALRVTYDLARPHRCH